MLLDSADGSPGEAGGAGQDAGSEAEADATAAADAPGGTDAKEAADTADAGLDAAGEEAEAGCASGLLACPSGQTCVGGQCGGYPTSGVSAYACAKGGCNAGGGACSAAGTCYCYKDSQCPSGKCVITLGQNNVSCTGTGGSCTGSGAADGFDCQIGSPGIPPVTTSGFGYVPSNFVTAGHGAAGTATTINCRVWYNSSIHLFDGCAPSANCAVFPDGNNFCAGQPLPNIYPGVAQTSGGPAVDILAFSSLTINAGSILFLESGNPVILAVYGNATIAGTINADGADGATNSSSGAASGPGGNYGCGGSAGSSPANGPTISAGGGGGGASGAGGAGGHDGSANAGGSGGSARANASVVPLYGGCPGGNSGRCGQSQSPGGGGGAVQISAAGTLSVSGTIFARGGAGGSGTSGQGCGASGYGGGAGGGSGGAVLLEGNLAPSAGTVNGGAGGASGTTSGGGAGTVGSATGGPGATDGTGQSGSGGGGGYGYRKSNPGAAPVYTCACATTLSPAPVCNGAHTACLCVADSDCSSGKCSNASSQCTGACTGATTVGAYDTEDCALVTSAASASCSTGNCDNVASPSDSCSGAGIPCWCTSDAQCVGGQCANWVGCPAGACTGSRTPDAFHCVP